MQRLHWVRATRRRCFQRVALLPALAMLAGLAACSGSSGSGSAVDPDEGTLSLTIAGQSADRLPLVCPDRRSISGEVAGYGLSATLTSDRTADIEVGESQYKAEPLTFRGIATVSLTSAAGPSGSLEGSASGTAGSVAVSARFTCSVAGGGVYAGRGGADATGGDSVALYLTVSHDGGRIVDLVANTNAPGAAHPLPNVQLRASGLAVAPDGRFGVTTPLVAEDPTGLVAQGRPATLEGRLDRVGGATGTIRFPDAMSPESFTWTGSVQGPIPRPTFPHAPLDTPVISAAAIAAEPAINELYPGSTDLDGGAPGAPVATPETPHEDYANMKGPFGFASWNTKAARAVREQRTPASVYDVAAWYTHRLTALGWATATDGRYGNEPGVVFLRGHERRLHLSFGGRRPIADATVYDLTLDEVSPGNGRLDTGLVPGDPEPAMTPCVPGEPAAISLSGTLSGTGITTCITQDSEAAVPSCTVPSVGMAVGQTRLDLFGRPYDQLVVTDGHWHGFTLTADSPPRQEVSGGTLHIAGTYSTAGYRETVDVTAACR